MALRIIIFIIYYYMILQWKCPEELRPKKASEMWLNVKVLLTVCFSLQWPGTWWVLISRSLGVKVTLFWSYATFAWNNSDKKLGQRNHYFYSTIMRLLTHRCSGFSFAKNVIVIMSQPGFTRLVPLWLFYVPVGIRQNHIHLVKISSLA